MRVNSFSILTKNFNILWTAALNMRDDGVTHFAMLHEDIGPEPWWLDKMMTLMTHNQADILSVIVPIKNNEGMTSTALDVPVPTQKIPFPWRVQRLTMHEVGALAPTFTHSKLLVNTGLMLVDIRKPWVEQCWFEFKDEIIPDPLDPRKFIAVGSPEDWNFSRRARALGASIWATREIRVEHWGRSRWANAGTWGTKKTDE